MQLINKNFWAKFQLFSLTKSKAITFNDSIFFWFIFRPKVLKLESQKSKQFFLSKRQRFWHQKKLYTSFCSLLGFFKNLNPVRLAVIWYKNVSIILYKFYYILYKNYKWKQQIQNFCYITQNSIIKEKIITDHKVESKLENHKNWISKEGTLRNVYKWK